MNVRELPGLKAIMGFEGEYAIFKANGPDGKILGLINRKGEIVWNDNLWHPILKMRDYDSVFFSMKRGVEGFVYFDAAQRKYIDRPQVSERPKSKAELIADNSEYLIYKDENGHEIYMQSIRALTDELLAYGEEPKKWGVKDLDGNIIIPAQFDSVSFGGDNQFIVEKNEQYGVIDLQGNWVIPFWEFDFLWCRGDYITARKDGKGGILDLKGNIIIPFDYEYLVPAYNEGLDLISAKKDGEFIFINSKQEKINLF